MALESECSDFGDIAQGANHVQLREFERLSKVSRSGSETTIWQIGSPESTRASPRNECAGINRMDNALILMRGVQNTQKHKAIR